MKTTKDRHSSKLLDRLFGGIPMTWPVVLLYALGTAVLTTIFLVLPVFKNTSFARMGETLEAWILFAVILMANCKKPLESALKTFVFFLVSQPLIYLFQVPFSYMGWALFGYYRYWFIWTLLTFPMAFVGWYITKRNWLSALILAPVIGFLCLTGFGGIRECMNAFPRYLVLIIFCFLQVFLYIYVFFPNRISKLAGAALVAALVLVFWLVTPKVSIGLNDYLPDEPSLSAEAYLSAVEENGVCEVRLTDYEDAYVHIEAHKYGTASFTIRDGDKEYRYLVEVYNDKGTDRVVIKRVDA